MGTPVTQLGRYRLVRELGRGGMGVVYEGLSPDGAPVAIKVLLSPPDDLELLARFQREAQVASTLRHPHLVPVLDAGVERGRPFLVMERIDGESLHDRLRRSGALSPAAVAAIGRDLADALAYVHGRGVLHRDLKPHNVLIDDQGRTRLTDFGLARSRDDARSLTHSGQLLGTPAYMAPEQALAQRDAIGPPADVYGLGATLYHLVSGQPPFSGASTLAILDAVVTKAPRPLRERRPDLDPQLASLIEVCLAKEPQARPDAASLCDALTGWVLAAEAPASSRRRLSVAGVGLLLTGAIGLGGAAVSPLLSRPEPTDGVAAVTTEAPPPPPSLPVEEDPVWASLALVTAFERGEISATECLARHDALLQRHPDSLAVRGQRAWLRWQRLLERLDSLRGAERAAALDAVVADLQHPGMSSALAKEPRLRATLGQALHYRGRWPEAYAELSVAVRVFGDEAGVVRDAGMAALRCGRFPEAELHLARARGLLRQAGAPPSAAVAQALGDARQAIGDWPRALEAYEEALRIGGESPTRLLRQAEGLLAASRLEEAARTLERVEVLLPDNSATAVRTVELFLRAGKVEEGEALARRLEARLTEPEHRAELLGCWAAGYVALGRLDDARALLESGREARSHLGLARARAIALQASPAGEERRPAELGLDPAEREAAALLAALRRRRLTLSQCVERLDRLLERYPEQPTVRAQRGQLRLSLASQQQAALSPAQRRALLEGGVADLLAARQGGAWGDADSGFRRDLGVALFQLRRWEEAYDELRIVAEALHEPRLRGAAGMCAWHLGRYSESVALLQRAVAELERAGAADPTDWLLAATLGDGLQLTGDYAGALTAYERARRLGGAERPEPLLGMGEVLMAVGRLTDAEQALQRAAQVGGRTVKVRLREAELHLRREEPARADALLAEAQAELRESDAMAALVGHTAAAYCGLGLLDQAHEALSAPPVAELRHPSLERARALLAAARRGERPALAPPLPPLGGGLQGAHQRLQELLQETAAPQQRRPLEEIVAEGDRLSAPFEALRGPWAVARAQVWVAERSRLAQLRAAAASLRALSQRAVADFERARRLQATELLQSPQARLDFAHALFEVGRREEALEEALACTRLIPGNGAIWMQVGIWARGLGRDEEAVKHLERAEACGETSWPMLYNLAGSLAALDRWDEALAVYERAHALGNGPQVRLRQTEIALHLSDDRPEHAEAALRDAARFLNDAQEDARRRLDRGEAEAAGHWDQARALRVRLLGRQGQPAAALALADSLRGELRGDPRLRLELNATDVLARLGRVREALEVLDRARAAGVEGDLLDARRAKLVARVAGEE